MAPFPKSLSDRSHQPSLITAGTAAAPSTSFSFKTAFFYFENYSLGHLVLKSQEFFQLNLLTLKDLPLSCCQVSSNKPHKVSKWNGVALRGWLARVNFLRASCDPELRTRRDLDIIQASPSICTARELSGPERGLRHRHKVSYSRVYKSMPSDPHCFQHYFFITEETGGRPWRKQTSCCKT